MSADPVDPADPDADAPEWFRRSRSLRRVPLVAAVVVTIIIIRASQGTPAPALDKSCTSPAFALSTYSTESNNTVRWAVTGPAGMHFALAIAVDHFEPAPDGHLAPVPDAGVGAHDTRTTAPLTVPSDCTTDGTFGVVMPAGTYTVRLFRIVDTSGEDDVTSVAEKRFTVTAS